MISFAPLKKTFAFGTSKTRIEIPSVEIHDIETSTDRRARTLKHLIKGNHANHSIIYHDLRFNNHMPHILGSAYLLGAQTDHLNDIYDKESKELEPWNDSPGEITLDDWREYLGNRNYQRAYVDFFEDQLVRFGYNWQELIKNFLFDGAEPLVNNLIASLGHPLIHMGYAFELHSHVLAIEALAMACCSYNSLHKYVDHPPKSTGSASSASLLDILGRVKSDQRFDGAFPHPGAADLDKLFEEREAEVLEYWTSWDITNPKKQFEESQFLAAALLVGTDGGGGKTGEYDFFFVHLLTSSHAVRILIPLIPAEFQIPLVKQWWLLALAVYIVQGRPLVDVDSIRSLDIEGKDWKYVGNQALTGKQSLDSHYVKGVRALKEAADTWGDNEGLFLKAAVKFGDGFTKWGGF